MKYARELAFKENEFVILIEDDSAQPHYIQQLDFLIANSKTRKDCRLIVLESTIDQKTHKYSYLDYSQDQKTISIESQKQTKIN